MHDRSRTALEGARRCAGETGNDGSGGIRPGLRARRELLLKQRSAPRNASPRGSTQKDTQERLPPPTRVVDLPSPATLLKRRTGDEGSRGDGRRAVRGLFPLYLPETAHLHCGGRAPGPGLRHGRDGVRLNNNRRTARGLRGLRQHGRKRDGLSPAQPKEQKHPPKAEDDAPGRCGPETSHDAAAREQDDWECYESNRRSFRERPPTRTHVPPSSRLRTNRRQAVDPGPPSPHIGRCTHTLSSSPAPTP